MDAKSQDIDLQKTGPFADDTKEKARMQEERSSIKQCLTICADAAGQVNSIRTNVFEDVSAAQETDRLDCPAPFIPGYEDKDDAVISANLLHGFGREDLSIIRVRLTQCEPKTRYRTLKSYAKEVQYQGIGLGLSRGEVRIICEPLTKANVVESLQIHD